MSDKTVFLILNRAFVDEQFRQQLVSDLDGTVAAMGLTLTDEARVELKKALDEGSDFATGLDQRLSQSGISLHPGALLRQKAAGSKQPVDFGMQSAMKSEKAKAHPVEKRQTKSNEHPAHVTA
ncbi:MAG: hypothetical protein QME74_03660, partial [Candidatus Edwardsbacteria bacterium]|nr:hypothetical protein [Candidatus Edwardsbacteria bacterium]